MNVSLCHEFPNGIQWGQIQFTIENILIAGFRNDLLARDFAFLVVSACHMNMSATFGQIQNCFTPDSSIASGYDDHFSIDSYVIPFELPTLDPSPVWEETKNINSINIFVRLLYFKNLKTFPDRDIV